MMTHNMCICWEGINNLMSDQEIDLKIPESVKQKSSISPKV